MSFGKRKVFCQGGGEIATAEPPAAFAARAAKYPARIEADSQRRRARQRQRLRVRSAATSARPCGGGGDTGTPGVVSPPALLPPAHPTPPGDAPLGGASLPEALYR